MTSHLLGAIRVSVDYEPSQPTTVQQKEQLERAIDAAKDKNMRVILGIQPGHNTDVTGDPNGVKKFAAYMALVARTFPSVERLRGRQRAEPRPLLVPDVQRQRHDRVGDDVRGGARGELRRAEGRASGAST